MMFMRYGAFKMAENQYGDFTRRLKLNIILFISSYKDKRLILIRTKLELLGDLNSTYEVAASIWRNVRGV
jgi:hypothetical protein